MSELTRTRVSLYGRLADEATRKALPSHAFEARFGSSGEVALGKDDGYFVFTDVEPAVSPYSVILEGDSYQSRILQANLPTTTPVELTLPGEDELWVLSTGVDVGTGMVAFDAPPFLPTIRAGAAVLGPGGFSAKLDEDMEGSGVGFAVLDTVVGLAVPSLLRIVRSPSLLMQPGPYYPFEQGTTLVAIRVVANTLGDPPLFGASLKIDRVNVAALATTNIAGLDIRTVVLPGPVTLILGTDRALNTVSNERGDAVFYYPSDTPVAQIRVQVTRVGYVPATEIIAITAGARTSRTVKMNPA